MPDDTNATFLALGRLTVPELKQRYAEVFGEPVSQDAVAIVRRRRVVHALEADHCARGG